MTQYFDQLILDVDGVLLDSNELKAENIRQAASQVIDSEGLNDFVHFFTQGNGIPREQKIAAYFKDPTMADQILQTYNELNASRLHSVKLTPGANDFVRRWATRCPVWALSGGAQDEVTSVLESKGLAENLQAIYGGPTTKSEHLHHAQLQERVLYVGDSQCDSKVASEFQMKFVFMHRFTQFLGWREYFALRPEVTVIADLTEWPAFLQPNDPLQC